MLPAMWTFLGIVGSIVICSAILLTMIRMDRERTRTNWLEHEDERAFTEVINVRPYDHAQLERLRPIVEQVGILRVPRGSFQVWVIDSLGVVHDVVATIDAYDASEIAVFLAAELDAELIDDECITMSLRPNVPRSLLDR